MYIAPQGTIKLLTGVPLEPSYDHTIWFENATTQHAYFETKVKSGCTFTNQYYTRKERGVLRIQKNVESLYDINYMMFKNDGFVASPATAKWFYCFVTDVEYVNNEVTDVHFMIDVMQTWYFDYQLEQCFVEREHSETDELWENTIPENIEFGEHELNETDRPTVRYDTLDVPLFDDFAVVVASTHVYDPLTDAVYKAQGGLYNGVYSGVNCQWFYSDNVAGLNNFLQKLTDDNKTDSIVSIFMMPRVFVGNKSMTEIEPFKFPVEFNKATSLSYVLNGVTKTIRNKKLLTYPYNFFYVTSGVGTSAEYKYEYFSGDKCTFKAVGSAGCAPQIALIPDHYLYRPQFISNVDVADDTLNYNEAIYTGDFPQCSWNIDTFRAWLAQNKIQIGITAAKAVTGQLGKEMSFLGLLAGAVGATSIGAAATSTQALQAGTAVSNEVKKYLPGVGGSVGSEVSALIQGGLEASIQPNRNHGVNNSSLGYALKTLCYKFYYARIRPEYIEKIDSYFDRFGYKTNMTKVPNTKVRPQWTYTKTVGCTITGTLPAIVASEICNIYNRGITFWVHPENVGKYWLDNRPLASQPVVGSGETNNASVG